MSDHTPFAELLKEFVGSNRLVGVHMWEDDPDSFIVGTVDALTKSHFSLREIDSNGLEEDLEEHKISQIVRLHWDSGYLGGLDKLRKDSEWIKREFEESVSEGPEIIDSLRWAILDGAPVRLEFKDDEEGEGEYFLVKEVGERIVRLEQLVDGGERDGQVAVPIERIGSVEMSSGRTESYRYLLDRQK